MRQPGYISLSLIIGSLFNLHTGHVCTRHQSEVRWGVIAKTNTARAPLISRNLEREPVGPVSSLVIVLVSCLSLIKHNVVSGVR